MMAINRASAMTWPEEPRALSRVDNDRLFWLIEDATREEMYAVLLNIAAGHNYDAQQAVLEDLESFRADRKPDASSVEDGSGRDKQPIIDASSTHGVVDVGPPAPISAIASLLNPVQEAAQAINQAAIALQPRGIKRSAIEVSAEQGTHESSDQKRLKAYHQSLLARCLKCGTFCDKLETTNDICIHHDGELGVEDWHDAFPDEDRTVEELDTDYTRLELPEYFTWDCCDKTGEHMGCQRGHHVFTGSKTHQCRLEMLKEI